MRLIALLFVLALLPISARADDLPDPKLTPGEANPSLTAEVNLCSRFQSEEVSIGADCATLGGLSGIRHEHRRAAVPVRGRSPDTDRPRRWRQRACEPLATATSGKTVELHSKGSVGEATEHRGLFWANLFGNRTTRNRDRLDCGILQKILHIAKIGVPKTSQDEPSEKNGLNSTSGSSGYQGFRKQVFLEPLQKSKAALQGAMLRFNTSSDQASSASRSIRGSFSRGHSRNAVCAALPMRQP